MKVEDRTEIHNSKLVQLLKDMQYFKKWQNLKDEDYAYLAKNMSVKSYDASCYPIIYGDEQR